MPLRSWRGAGTAAAARCSHSRAPVAAQEELEAAAKDSAVKDQSQPAPPKATVGGKAGAQRAPRAARPRLLRARTEGVVRCTLLPRHVGGPPAPGWARAVATIRPNHCLPPPAPPAAAHLAAVELDEKAEAEYYKLEKRLKIQLGLIPPEEGKGRD